MAVIVGFMSSPQVCYAKERIAPYILDGSLVIYFPNIFKATATWREIFLKTSGIESTNILASLQFRIKERMSVNILDPQETTRLGIDPNGGLAYVHLRSGVGYSVFTVKNEILLRGILDRLEDPIPYRIEGQFVIFSSSIEVLEYYDFKGMSQLEDFKRMTDVVQFNWTQNLLWMDSSYFQDKGLFRTSVLTLPQGDRIAGTFNVFEQQMSFDLYTFYDEPQIQKDLKKSMATSPVQKLTLLDFEYGEPAIIGQTYVDIPSFWDMLLAIDGLDDLDIRQLQDDLLAIGVDLQKDLFPHLKGIFSYTIREYDPFQNKLNMMMSSGVINATILREKLNKIAQEHFAKGMKVSYKNVFTQQFYGWQFNDMTVWMGVVENNLIISTDEDTLLTLVQNIYEANGGFLNTLPPSFRRLNRRGIVGGQMYIRNPSFIQNISFVENLSPYVLLTAIKSMEWDFYLLDREGTVGRRDIIMFNFIN